MCTIVAIYTGLFYADLCIFFFTELIIQLLVVITVRKLLQSPQKQQPENIASHSMITRRDFILRDSNFVRSIYLWEPNSVP